MKRMVLAFLLVLALLSVSTVHAEPCDKLIQFRGLEWGEKNSEAVKEYDIIKSYAHYDNTRTIHNLMYGEKGENAKYDDRVGFIAKIRPDSLGKIAGYPLYDAGMLFAYTPDENGLLKEEMESAKLYMGYYEIRVSGTEGQDAAWTDLTQKLTSLYGDYDLETAPQDVYRLWYGAEGTMVSLKKHWSHSGNDYYVTILYSYEEGEKLLQNAQSAIDHEFSLITTGL